MMSRKRYYILFVARDEDGRVRKIPLPLHYAYGFVAAALVGAFTIVGLAGSYTRMLLKTESYNQVREDRENLRKDYKQMAQIAHERDVQVASLGALASEVSSLYGLKQNRLAAGKGQGAAAAAAAPTPPTLAESDSLNQQQVKQSIDQFYSLRSQALSSGSPVRATADGIVTGQEMGAGYGREVVLDHGHDVVTVYGHLSAAAVFAGQHVTQGQVIGYVGQTGRATGPHLHYEVRLHNVPVNPHKYLRTTYAQVAKLDGSVSGD
jgi:murein DD-endopeptidase MepM/ murein hydrolase activator NlpD